jgi:alpha-L-fucosidase
MPIEVCMTINDHWGIHFDDQNHKSTKHLVHNLVKSASMGGNYLLNVGPSAAGTILPEHARRLREVGTWLKVNGESIYGTRAGKILPSRQTVSTNKRDRYYVHVLDYISDCVKLEGVPDSVQTAYLLKDNIPLPFQRKDGKFEMCIPPMMRDACDTVVVLL